MKEVVYQLGMIVDEDMKQVVYHLGMYRALVENNVCMGN